MSICDKCITKTDAACYGHLECMRHLYENESNGRWDVQTTGYAAQGGFLDCVRYAHEHGAPWDPEVTRDAAIKGHFDCLRYAHENGASISFTGVGDTSGDDGVLALSAYIPDYATPGIYYLELVLVGDETHRMGRYDPLTYLAAAAILSLAAMGACYIPARRAAAMDPTTALRHDG